MLFRKDSCLMVGIHEQGADKILDVIGDTDMEWGTDGRAFAQMAYKYFTDTTITTSPPVDPDLSCQLRYVIVIGDGRVWNESPSSRAPPPCTNGCDAEAKIEELRHSLGVKTLVDAYGGGISTLGIEKLMENHTMSGMTLGTYQVKQLGGLKKNLLELVSEWYQIVWCETVLLLEKVLS